MGLPHSAHTASNISRVPPAIRTRGGVSLAGSARSRTAGLASLTASLAAGGLVLEALLGVEFLFTGSENKFIAAVFANQRLVSVHGIGTP